MTWIIGLAFALGVAVPVGAYFLVRRKVRHPLAWALAALPVHLGAAWLLRFVLEAVYAPRLMGEGGYVSLYRDGDISLNAYEELATLNRNATLACLATGLVAAAIFVLAVRLLGARAAAMKAEAEAPARPAQIVGQDCAVCGKRLIIAGASLRCEHCGAPLHRDCRDRHTCKSAEPTARSS